MAPKIALDNNKNDLGYVFSKLLLDLETNLPKTKRRSSGIE